GHGRRQAPRLRNPGPVPVAAPCRTVPKPPWRDRQGAATLSPMGDLQADTAIEPDGDGCFRGEPSPDWEIWGPMGGYIASFALRAVGAVTSHRRPTTFSCHYLG